MLHEIYNITVSDMQELMNSLAHPSMEYAVQQEERMQKFFQGMHSEQIGDTEEVTFDDLDLSFIEKAPSYVKAVPQSTAQFSFSSSSGSALSVYSNFTSYAA